MKKKETFVTQRLAIGSFAKLQKTLKVLINVLLKRLQIEVK